MKTILLVTEQYDPTADNLIQVLCGRGRPFLRWNLDRYPQGSTLTYHASTEGFGGALSVDGQTVPLDAIGSVWYRALRCRGFPSGLKPEELEFAIREAENTVQSLPAVTDWHWMNKPGRHRAAQWKPAQLAVARRLGLRIPRTVITNDPNTIREFHEQCGGAIIYKPHSQTLSIEPGKAAFTGIVSDKTLSSLDLIRHTPGIFQELVAKDCEVRLTVVEDKMFAARILSQKNERTKLDWRTAPYELNYEPTELPADIRDKVRALMAEYGITYSCLDFIVTPDGEYVFLESNPRGQYLWIEYYTGMPITEAIADSLTGTFSPCNLSGSISADLS
jgi:glutathione synthase/RimK-type ligase-like ATP-grasp enzyme